MQYSDLKYAVISFISTEQLLHIIYICNGFQVCKLSSLFQVTAINASYTDAGLFGFQVAAPSKEVGGVLEKTVAAFNEVKNGGITEEDVTRGK